MSWRRGWVSTPWASMFRDAFVLQREATPVLYVSTVMDARHHSTGEGKTMSGIASLYGIPDGLLEFVNVGFLEIFSENPENGSIRFCIPSMRERDCDGNTLTYSLKWSRTPFETDRGYRANFELVIRHEEADYDYVELLETTGALIAWLTGATRFVRRKRVDTPIPTPEELADAFSAVLNAQLPPKTIAEINRRNASGDPSHCATHEFCDAEQAMVDALWSFGVHFEPEVEILNLVQDAWRVAKARSFAMKATIAPPE